MNPTPRHHFFLRSAFSLGVLIAVFPWTFSYKGEVLGHSVSIRALGDVVGVGIAVMGGVLLLSRSFQAVCADIAASLEALPAQTQRRLMFAGVGLFVAGVISHKLRAHSMIDTHAFDLGFFSNICWNTAHGRWFFSSMLERNFIAVHTNWILWPLSVFYRLVPGAPILLIAQAVLLAAAIPILWRMTQSITGSYTAGAIAAFLFMSSPTLGQVFSNDFHPDIWQVPCLFASLWAWRQNKPVLLLLTAMGALLAKEDVSVVLCGYAIFLAAQKNWRTTGIILFLLSAVVLVIQTRFFIPHFLDENQQSVLFSRYTHLGNNFQEMGRNIFLQPSVYVRAFFYDPAKFIRFACYFLPVAGLTLLSPLFLIPPFISVVPHLLSHAFTQLSLADIYALPSQPFIFIGAAYGAKRLLERLDPRRTVFLAGLLLVVGGVGIYQSPSYYRLSRPERVQAFREMSRLIPPDASLAAQQNIYPHFDGRQTIQIFSIRTAMPYLQTRVLENPDYVACDRVGNSSPFSSAVITADIADMEKNPVAVLVVMTGMILSGKIHIKKKTMEAKNADGNSSESNA
jgi:uncharacterized membrane protein